MITVSDRRLQNNKEKPNLSITWWGNYKLVNYMVRQALKTRPKSPSDNFG